MTTIYFAGGEDVDHYEVGGGFVSQQANSYRSSFARCSLGIGVTSAAAYWANYLQYAGTPTEIYWSGRVTVTSNSTSNGNSLVKFVDASGFVRLQVIVSSGNLIVQKVNTAGTATTLANTLAPWPVLFSGSSINDKIDIHWDNDGSGSVDIYLNEVHVYNYSGDTTTETLDIAGHRLFSPVALNNSFWSEVIVADCDTRALDLKTYAPVANGNTHDFDTGTPAASNVNEIFVDDTNLDASTVAGQKDQYTCPANPAGTYGVLAFGISARLIRGTSGPSKADLGVRTGGTDYWEADHSLDTAWGCFQDWWTLNPGTSANWLPTDIGNASGFNIGVKSVA